ncbi:Geranylgeranyltransferase_type-1 subunit beta [Hexamita inflata]|uniref:Geranylgeranyltransferase type-1 subunit beta n=2 Tax=Hexamita inflata TaxID=28002 RepID=A0AA86RGZ0_9EUKA|nr:Geranylgeranyltransferase type-1 subunit beta [Hexamita inflata]
MNKGEICRHGHAVLAIKALQKQFDDTKIENERTKAVFLAVAILDLLDFQDIIQKYKDKLEKLIMSSINNAEEPIQSLQCVLQLAVLLNYDFSQNAQQLLDYTLSLFTQDGVIECHNPQTYTDARNMSSGTICVYLILKKYQNIVKISQDEVKRIHGITQNFIASCRTFSGAFAMSESGEEHGGGFLLNIIPMHLMNKTLELTGSQINQITISDMPDVLFKMVQRQQLLFQGRPNKPECLCYCLWVFGAAVILGKEQLFNLQVMKSQLLSCQFKMKPSAAEELIIKMTPAKDKFEDCSGKLEWASYLMKNYGKILCGFILAEEKPDLLHSYAALCALKWEQMDFSVFMPKRAVDRWE